MNKNCLSTARGGPWTPQFQKYFDGAGLDINKSVENLVALADHKGPHPKEYHAYVEKENATIIVSQNIKDIYEKNHLTGACFNKVTVGQ